MFQEDSYITYLAVSSQDRLGHWLGPRGIVGNYRSPYGKPLSSFSFFSIIVNPSFRDEFDHFSFAGGRGGSTISREATLERARTHTHTPPPRKEICTSVPRLPFNRGAFCPRCFLQLRFPFCTRFLFLSLHLDSALFLPPCSIACPSIRFCRIVRSVKSFCFRLLLFLLSDSAEDFIFLYRSEFYCCILWSKFFLPRIFANNLSVSKMLFYLKFSFIRRLDR